MRPDGLSERIADAARRIDAGAGEIGDRKVRRSSCPLSSAALDRDRSRASTPPARQNIGVKRQRHLLDLAVATVLPTKSSASARVSTRSARSAERSTFDKKLAGLREAVHVHRTGHSACRRSLRRDRRGFRLSVVRSRSASIVNRPILIAEPDLAAPPRRKGGRAPRSEARMSAEVVARVDAKQCPSDRRCVSPGSVAVKLSMTQPSIGGR